MSPQEGASPARRKLLSPCPTSRHHHPRPLRLMHHKASHAVSPTKPVRPIQDRLRSVCLSSERQLGDLTSPKPAPAPRFLAPSTEDAHVSPPSPLSLAKHLQPKGMVVPDPQSGLRHKQLRAFARPIASPKRAALPGCAREARGQREAPGVPL